MAHCSFLVFLFITLCFSWTRRKQQKVRQCLLLLKQFGPFHLWKELYSAFAREKRKQWRRKSYCPHQCATNTTLCIFTIVHNWIVWLYSVNSEPPPHFARASCALMRTEVFFWQMAIAPTILCTLTHTLPWLMTSLLPLKRLLFTRHSIQSLCTLYLFSPCVKEANKGSILGGMSLSAGQMSPPCGAFFFFSLVFWLQLFVSF